MGAAGCFCKRGSFDARDRIAHAMNHPEDVRSHALFINRHPAVTGLGIRSVKHHMLVLPTFYALPALYLPIRATHDESLATLRWVMS